MFCKHPICSLCILTVCLINNLRPIKMIKLSFVGSHVKSYVLLFLRFFFLWSWVVDYGCCKWACNDFLSYRQNYKMSDQMQFPADRQPTQRRLNWLLGKRQLRNCLYFFWLFSHAKTFYAKRWKNHATIYFLNHTKIVMQ